jgi:hypothetical protein
MDIIDRRRLEECSLALRRYAGLRRDFLLGKVFKQGEHAWCFCWVLFGRLVYQAWNWRMLIDGHAL